MVSELFRLPVGLRAQYAGGALLEDPDLAPPAAAGGIDAAALARVRKVAAAALGDDELLGRWFGSYITAGDPSGPRHRLAHYAAKDAVYLFVDGEEIVLPPACKPLVEILTATRAPDPAKLRAALPRAPEARKLAQRLLRDMARNNLLGED